MITAVDSSVLLDVLTASPGHCDQSKAALRRARQTGLLIVCPVVWAEVRAFFQNERELATTLDDAGIVFDPFDLECANLAGKTWRSYRQRGGPRTRLIADFLIAAHAQVRSGRLLTRDRGFYRRYFDQLAVIEPGP